VSKSISDIENERAAIAQPQAPGQGGEHTWGAAHQDEPEPVSGGKLVTIMVSVLLGILLAALDQTVVGPAMPRIIGDLKGFEYYSWVFTIYLLTSTITVPIFGKLSDMYGRKWFFISGIAVFLVGSALSGLSQDIVQLILFRGLQGVGAGILVANAFAIIADLIPPAERGKWQGAFGAVWGLASVIGPTVGGFLTDNLSWHWVFYVNIPVGIVALAALITFFPHESKHHTRKVIDWLGVTTLTASVTPLLVALSFGQEWGWGSPQIVGMFVAAVVFLAVFIWAETRAPEPILPLHLFKNSIFSVSMLTVFFTGVGMFGAIIYIPLFIQAIQGGSATSSGNSITPMTMSVVFASIIAGQLMSRTGKYRVLAIVGGALVTVGMALLYTMNMGTERWVTIAFMIVLGLGMGISFPLYTLVVQNSVSFKELGVATAALQFFRSIGSTVGVAVLGTVVNTQFHTKFGPEFATRYDQLKAGVPATVAGQMPPADAFLKGLSNLNPQVLVSDQGVAQLKDQLVAHGTPATFVGQIVDLIMNAMKPALFGGIQEAFFIGTALVALGLVATLFLKEIPLRKSNRGSAMAMAEGGAPEGEVVGSRPERHIGEMPRRVPATVAVREEPRLARD
jgi:EmrB/QacA subfamily drug resistance transporter